MKRHAETIRLIDEQLMLHRAGLAENPDGIVDHADLRVRIEELEKTKMRLVLDQANTESDG